MNETNRIPEQVPVTRSGELVSDDGLSIDSSGVYSLQALRARAASFLHRIRFSEDEKGQEREWSLLSAMLRQTRAFLTA